MGWDFNTGSNSSAKAEFTKFPEGITRIRVIDSEPYVRWTHWMMQHKRSINCPGKGCPICEVRKQQKANKEPYTQGMSRRFAINVFNLDTNKVEIMEQGIGFFEDLRDIMEDLKSKGKELKDVVLRVKRRGTGKDNTSYRIDVDNETPISVTEFAELQTKAIKLDEYFKPHTNEQILAVLQGKAWDEVMKVEKDDAPFDVVDEEIEIS